MFLQKIALPRVFVKSQPAYKVVEPQFTPIKEICLVGNELQLAGTINHKNYLQLIDEGHQAYKRGSKQLVINFKHVDGISTPGLFALYSLLLILQGQEPPTHMGGHSALSQMAHDLKTGSWKHLLQIKNASPQIESILNQAGFNL